MARVLWMGVLECLPNGGGGVDTPIRPARSALFTVCGSTPMCLIALALDAHPSYRLVITANRDEFYARPTAPAAGWADAPDVLAGRDLREGGTWMGVTRGGRVAAVTNYRDPGLAQLAGAPSRGALVADFLRGSVDAQTYAHDLAR